LRTSRGAILARDAKNGIDTQALRKQFRSNRLLRQLRDALSRVVAVMPKALAGRLRFLTGASKKAKSHTYFLLMGPIGLYVIASLDLPPRIKEVFRSLLKVCGDLWAKEIDRCEAPACLRRGDSVLTACLQHAPLSLGTLSLAFKGA
jgi:hypothetical protein